RGGHVVSHRLLRAHRLELGNLLAQSGLAVAPGRAAEVVQGPLELQFALPDGVVADSRDVDHACRPRGAGESRLAGGDDTVPEVELREERWGGGRLLGGGTGDGGQRGGGAGVVLQGEGNGLGQRQGRNRIGGERSRLHLTVAGRGHHFLDRGTD